jgi:resuscitation-promoting factor RpfB
VSVDAVGLGSVAFGAVMLYAGIKGISAGAALTSVVKGTSPAGVPVTAAITGTPAAAAAGAGGVNAGGLASTAGNTGAANAGAASNQALAKQLAASLGHSDWTSGQNWDDWVSLWNQESGWNTDAANPSSDARGIAQNINGYGPGYEQGNAASQITWGINYIAQRYGSPSMAWAHEVANNWY